MIYLDSAATTRTDPRVVEAMKPYETEKFFNPSAIYAEEARDAIERAQVIISEFVGCSPRGVIFTSGGTESDNMAIAGAAFEHYASTGKPIRIVTSNIEHKAVLETCGWLERAGLAKVRSLSVDERGCVDYRDVKQLVESSEVDLVSVMAVNNEIGTIQPVSLLGWACNTRDKVLFHTDAVQAVHCMPINMKCSCIDMFSMSAHKFNGPKGVGALCLSEYALNKLRPILHGGGQQRGLRSGTENVPGIVGMAAAIELMRDEWAERYASVQYLDNIMREALSRIRDSRFNGSGGDVDVYNYGYISISFKDIDAETLLMVLKNRGIYASAGSACNSDSIEISHVLKAINVPDEYIKGTIRLTFNHELLMHEALTACKEIAAAVKMLRGY